MEKKQSKSNITLNEEEGYRNVKVLKVEEE